MKNVEAKNNEATNLGLDLTKLGNCTVYQFFALFVLLISIRFFVDYEKMSWLP